MGDDGFEIVVVDDEEWVRRGLISKLGKSGLPIRDIKDFAEGGSVLAYIERGGRPDIMICDIRMPGVDGLRLAALVRERLVNLRVIISSGYGEFEYAKQAIRAGVSEYLLKPIDNVELFMALKTCMDSIALSRQNGERLARLGRIEREDRVRRSLDTGKGAGDLGDIFPAYGKDSAQFIAAYFRVPRLTGALFHDLVIQRGPEFLNPSGVDNLVFYSCAPDEYILLFLALSPLEKVRAFAGALAVQVRNMTVPAAGTFPEIPAAGLSGVRESVNAAAAEARELMKYRVLMTEPALINPPDIAPYGENYAIPGHHISALRYALAEGNEKNLDAILDAIEGEIGALKLSYRSLENVCLSLSLPVNELWSTAAGETALFLDPYKFGALKTLFGFVKKVYRGCAEGVRESASGEKSSTAGKAAVIRNIAASIDTHFNEYLTLELFGMNYGINVSYLSILFKAVMGVNFQEYLSQVRIRKAKEFLASGRFKVGEVAEKTGYTSRFYFSKAFKKIEGLTPSEFMGTVSK
jgi:AraC-like DNA-binding protein/DNA-binding NarL/FixJ family response regulator